MADVTVQKRGEVYQYKFEIASIDGKRKFKNKSGFATKSEAKQAGIIAYNEYLNTGHSFKPKTMSYSDYLDYWMKEHCEINLKYHTIEAYKNIIKNHIKPRLGFYRLCQITTATIQEFVNNTYVEYGYSKNFMKNILKVLKTSFSYATDVVGFVKENPTIKVKLPKYDKPDEDPAHIFTKEEIDTILNRFKKNHCAYYAMLTAYHTGLRISEVFGLTWDDIDLENKKLTVNKNVLKKNQAGATHGRHISGKATTMWFFGTCKTPSSYRTIDIGDTLVNALKEDKAEQEANKKEYGDYYMMHYAKTVKNPYTNKDEIKIINAYTRSIKMESNNKDLEFVEFKLQNSQVDLILRAMELYGFNLKFMVNDENLSDDEKSRKQAKLEYTYHQILAYQAEQVNSKSVHNTNSKVAQNMGKPSNLLDFDTILQNRNVI